MADYLVNSIIFVALALFLGAILRRLKPYGVPCSPVLFFTGLFLGNFSTSLGQIGQAANIVSNIDPRGILVIFLPALIFQSGFNSDWHIFRKQSGQIFVLAFPCVACCAFFLMLSLKVLLGYGQEHYSWLGAYMFGAILSCTDTVAVLSLLKQIGAPRKFSSLIEGQSLLNDGSCMVIFSITLKMMLGGSQTILGVIKLFFEMTVGGLVLGVLFGVLTNYLIKTNSNEPLFILNVTVSMCYITYFVAQYVDLGIKVSGIMSLVGLGLFVGVYGKSSISHQNQLIISSFWKYFIFIAETVIFLLAGAMVGTRVIASAQDLALTSTDFLKLFSLYLCMIASRFLGIVTFKFYLSNSGYGLTLKQIFVLTVGGLRGAVGISFALIVAQNQGLPPTLRKMILFHMAGCALLTLLINSPLTGPIVRRLGMCTDSIARQRVYLNFLENLVSMVRVEQVELRQNKYMQGAD